MQKIFQQKKWWKTGIALMACWLFLAFHFASFGAESGWWEQVTGFSGIKAISVSASAVDHGKMVVLSQSAARRIRTRYGIRNVTTYYIDFFSNATQTFTNVYSFAVSDSGSPPFGVPLKAVGANLKGTFAAFVLKDDYKLYSLDQNRRRGTWSLNPYLHDSTFLVDDFDIGYRYVGDAQLNIIISTLAGIYYRPVSLTGGSWVMVKIVLPDGQTVSPPFPCVAFAPGPGAPAPGGVDHFGAYAISNRPVPVSGGQVFYLDIAWRNEIPVCYVVPCGSKPSGIASGPLPADLQPTDPFYTHCIQTNDSGVKEVVREYLVKGGGYWSLGPLPEGEPQKLAIDFCGCPWVVNSTGKVFRINPY